MRTVLVDFLVPRGGRTGGGRLSEDSRFSLFSSDGAASLRAAGDAGIVLKRFFSGVVAFLSEEDDIGLVRMIEVAEREVGVAEGFRTPDGLVADGRDVGLGAFLAGVEGVVLLEVGILSVLVEGAKDIRFGLAEMPSFFLSSSASTELTEACLRSDGVGVVVFLEEGLFVVDIFGRAGGLLRVVVGDDLEAEVAVCLNRFEVRGATGLVNGLFGGTPDLIEGFVLSSERDGTLSAIL